jgi:hypothetical protein
MFSIETGGVEEESCVRPSKLKASAPSSSRADVRDQIIPSFSDSGEESLDCQGDLWDLDGAGLDRADLQDPNNLYESEDSLPMACSESESAEVACRIDSAKSEESGRQTCPADDGRDQQGPVPMKATPMSAAQEQHIKQERRQSHNGTDTLTHLKSVLSSLQGDDRSNMSSPKTEPTCTTNPPARRNKGKASFRNPLLEPLSEVAPGLQEQSGREQAEVRAGAYEKLEEHEATDRTLVASALIDEHGKDAEQLHPELHHRESTDTSSALLSPPLKFLFATEDVDADAEMSFEQVLPMLLASGFSLAQCSEIKEELRSEGPCTESKAPRGCNNGPCSTSEPLLWKSCPQVLRARSAPCMAAAGLDGAGGGVAAGGGGAERGVCHQGRNVHACALAVCRVDECIVSHACHVSAQSVDTW